MVMDFNQRTFGKAKDESLVDEGLKAYMLRVYNYMASGLLLTGLVAFIFGKATTQLLLFPASLELVKISIIFFNIKITSI